MHMGYRPACQMCLSANGVCHCVAVYRERAASLSTVLFTSDPFFVFFALSPTHSLGPISVLVVSVLNQRSSHSVLHHVWKKECTVFSA